MAALPQTHSLADTAAALGVGEQWLASQVRQGLVPAHRLGRRWRFTDEDVEQILAAAATGRTATTNPWGLTPRSQRRRRTS